GGHSLARTRKNRQESAGDLRRLMVGLGQQAGPADRDRRSQETLEGRRCPPIQLLPAFSMSRRFPSPISSHARKPIARRSSIPCSITTKSQAAFRIKPPTPCSPRSSAAT